MAEQVMSLPTDRRSVPVPMPLTQVAAGTPCDRCGTRIEDRYFVANGHVVCPHCRSSLEGSTSKAVGFGLAAAVLSAAVYYAVYALWEMNFVLIAVIAGVSIGLAVRRGAQGNRAKRFRWIAVVLTYLCAVSTYYPALLAMPGVAGPLSAAVRSLYLPFLMLISMKNPVTLILLGFGLHEAWKLSAPHVVNVDGPFAAVKATAATSG